MQNFQQNGERLRLYPAESVKSGDVVIVGGLVGIAFSHYDVADEDGVICDLVGVYSLPKATGAWTQGAEVYWDAANKVATTAASGNTLIGHAADVATADAALGFVRLKG